MAGDDFLEALPGHLPAERASQELLPGLVEKLRQIAALPIQSGRERGSRLFSGLAMVPIHGLWTPHTVTLVLGLVAKHRPLPALFDFAVTVNPQRRAVLGAAARRISRWFRARSFLSKCDAIFDAFEKCVSSWGSISALPSRELCEQRHLVVFNCILNPAHPHDQKAALWSAVKPLRIDSRWFQDLGKAQ